MNHRIIPGNVNYWPNRHQMGGPVPPQQGGYQEFVIGFYLITRLTKSLRYAQKVAGIKQRVRGAKFQEHYNQAQLFINSLSDYHCG